MLDIDKWVWDRSIYWWDRLNRAYHTLYEIPEINITDRLSRKAGTCRVLRGKLEITLYEHYIHTEGEKFDQTIGHELAHAHNWCHHHEINHGDIWKAAMRKIGLPALRCHSYRVPNTHIFNCACGRQLTLGKTVYRKMMEGEIRFCIKCKRKVGYINDIPYSHH